MNEKNPYASVHAIAFIVAKGISRFKLNLLRRSVESAIRRREATWWREHVLPRGWAVRSRAKTRSVRQANWRRQILQSLRAALGRRPGF